MVLAFIFSNLAGTARFLKGGENSSGNWGISIWWGSDGMHGWDGVFILRRLNESQVV